MSKRCIKCSKRCYGEYCFRCKPRKAIQTKKRPPQRGKRYYEYETWKHEVAIPYLDKTFGHVCADCGEGDYGQHILQVEHKITRGSRADLKMNLTNVQWLGAYPCHYNKTNHLGKYRRQNEQTSPDHD